MAPIVRIPYEGDQDYKHLVKQLLSQGIFGIILPRVKTAEEARRLVATMRYPPQRGAKYPEPAGIMGASPGAAIRFWGLTEEEYYRKADVWPLNPEGELLAIVMIETVEAVENIDEILSVPGLGAALIGPTDLAFSYGVAIPPSDSIHPEVEAAIQTVGEACVRHGALCGFAGGVPENLDTRLAQGFRLFTGTR